MKDNHSLTWLLNLPQTEGMNSVIFLLRLFLGETHTIAGEFEKAVHYLTNAEQHARKSPQQFLLAGKCNRTKLPGFGNLRDAHKHFTVGIEKGNPAIKP